MLPKMYLGLDASRDRNVEYNHPSQRYFTIATVTTQDIQIARKTAYWLEVNWPGKKAKDYTDIGKKSLPYSQRLISISTIFTWTRNYSKEKSIRETTTGCIFTG